MVDLGSIPKGSSNNDSPSNDGQEKGSNMTTTTRTHVIPVSKKSSVEEQIAKMNKRGAKMGLAPITLTWGKAYVEERNILYQDPNYPEMEPVWKRANVLVSPVEVTGPLEVKYDGWTFIGSIQNLAGGESIVRSISDKVAIPEKYRLQGTTCEHCKTNRFRNDTYVVYKEGTYVQVGSTCVKDFLGGLCPDMVVSAANFLSNLVSFLDGAEHYEERGSSCLELKGFLVQTCAQIREYGWMSKGKAEESGSTPTSQCVLSSYTSKKFYVQELERDEELAKAAMVWCEEMSDTDVSGSEYLTNIRAIARSGYVDYRTAGYAASIIPAYQKAMDKLEDQSRKAKSEYVGTIKKREVFHLIFDRQYAFESTYGTTFLYSFFDKSGNVLVWKSSTRQSFDKGVMYTVKATVKDHSVYRDVKQTILTRGEVQ